MALQIFPGNSFGAGVRIDLGSTDHLFVGKNALIGSTDDKAIVATGSGQHIEIEGTVVAEFRAIELGNQVGDNGNSLFIGEGAMVSSLANDFAPAIYVYGSNAYVENRGLIHGYTQALGLGGTFGTSTVVNIGVIEGKDYAITRHGNAQDDITINNSGVITGGSNSYSATGSGKDTINNTGTMKGDIDLSNGVDAYNGAGGFFSGKLNAGGGADTIVGGAWSEWFDGSAGADTLNGGGGNDTLLGGTEDDLLIGGLGNDNLNGQTGIDVMLGGAGNDTYVVDVAKDVVSEVGGSGIDTILSSFTFNMASAQVKGLVEKLVLSGNGTINGTGDGLANQITGNAAANALTGAAGKDILNGLGGADTLNGGIGNDTLTGGANNDKFVFNIAVTVANRDTITDFLAPQDTIQLSDAVFKGIGPEGFLKAAAFKLGTKATDADDRVIYNKASGAVLFDADGNGAGAAVQFATLVNKATITHLDFQII